MKSDFSGGQKLLFDLLVFDENGVTKLRTVGCCHTK
jgi:hypothetical protein